MAAEAVAGQVKLGGNERRGREQGRLAGLGGLELYVPEAKYTGDNAAMVGAAAVYEVWSGVEPVDPYRLEIAPRRVIE